MTKDKLRVDLQTADGKEVAFHTYTKDDEPFDIQAVVPDGYVLAAGQHLLTTLSENQSQVTYLLRQRVVNVDAKHAAKAGEVIKDTATKTFPKGVSEDDLKRVVKRTINVKSTLGTIIKSVENRVVFTRTAQVNAVTGKVTYSPWSMNGQAVLPGYLAASHDGEQIEPVKAVKVTPNSENLQVTIQYQPAAREVKLTYRDSITGKVVKTDDHPVITGNSVKLTAPRDYMLSTESNQLTIGTAAKQSYQILVHQVD